MLLYPLTMHTLCPQSHFLPIYGSLDRRKVPKTDYWGNWNIPLKVTSSKLVSGYSYLHFLSVTVSVCSVVKL